VIEQADQKVGDWAQRVVGNSVLLSYAPPTAVFDETAVNLYLWELLDAPPLRSQQRPPLQIHLRYLVTTWAEDPTTAHRLLGQLVFAALANPEFDIDLTPLPAASWLALNIIPRPAFFLRIPLRLEQPEPDIPLVRAPVVLNGTPVTTLHGIIYGPKQTPLSGARIELPALQRSTYSDAHGKFHFATIPADHQQAVRIKAKGQLIELTAAPTPDPLIVTIDL
jgi:hypothetical protein